MVESERDREALLSNLKMSETRTSLRENREITGDKTLITNERGYPKLEQIRNANQEVVRDGKSEKAKLYEKNWSYHREQGADGQWQDTERVKSISETEIQHSEDGRTETIHGNHLMREHAWETTNEYDEQGRITASRGEVTEGLEKGNTWSETNDRRQIGDYIETVSVNSSSKRNESGEMVKIRTVKIEYRDAQGQSVWGEKQSEGKPDTYHAWGAEPADLPTESRRKLQELMTEGQQGE